MKSLVMRSNAEFEALEKDLENARNLVQEQNTILSRIAEAGLELSTIVGTTPKEAGGDWIILSNGVHALNNGYDIGDTVLCYPKTGQVVERVGRPTTGPLTTIKAVRDEGTVEIMVGQERRIIHSGYVSNLECGDVVMVDQQHTVVLALIEKAKKSKLTVDPVTWDEIGGNEEAKLLLREAIEFPHKYPILWASYGKKPVAGILLFGAPGNGKTLLGRAVATALGSAEGFISVKGPEVLDPYVGVSEQNVRDLFARAKAHKQETGNRAVIFIDEAEALLTTRSNHHNYMGQTIVPTFLTEMQGLEGSSAIVILSTNRRDMLDPAVIRDGRIDFKVEVKPPTRTEGPQIFDIHMGRKPIKVGHHRENIIGWATEQLYGLGLKVSGAMIEGCVNKAVTSAIRRDMATGAKASGLCEADFTWAVEQINRQEAA